ncbi:HAD family hydrolase [Nanoarchaeota archaeon]
MIKLVVFDMDGVLVDSKNAYVGDIHKTLKKYNFNFTKREISNALGARMIHTLKNLQNFSFLSIKKISKDVHNRISNEVSSFKMCPYVVPVLKSLKKDKAKIVLLTNSRKKYALNFLNKHKITKYFNLVVGGDQFGDKKEVFPKIFRKFKVKPQEVIYVGDRISDLVLAKGAKCHSLLVYDCSWEKKFIKEKKYYPYIIKDLRGLVRFKKAEGFLEGRR